MIERDGQYLLAHRSDIPWWNLVGGGLEYGETLEEGLAREAREEIGAEIEVVRLVGVYSKPQKREVVFTFLCHLTPDSPAPHTSEEVSRVAWFLPHHFPANLLPKHCERLQDALRGQAAAIVRAQTTSTQQDQGLDSSDLKRRLAHRAFAERPYDTGARHSGANLFASPRSTGESGLLGHIRGTM